jgi:hypothetical protein
MPPSVVEVILTQVEPSLLLCQSTDGNGSPAALLEIIICEPAHKAEPDGCEMIDGKDQFLLNPFAGITKNTNQKEMNINWLQQGVNSSKELRAYLSRSTLFS